MVRDIKKGGEGGKEVERGRRRVTYGIFVQGVDEAADGCSVVNVDQKLGDSLTIPPSPNSSFPPVASHAI